MTHFSYEITISAKTELEATTKIGALTTLASKLTDKELARLAHIVKNDPVKTALAKSYLMK